MKHLLLIAFLATPTYAGGPVIVEDATEAAPAGHSLKDALPMILIGLAIAAIASGDNCNAPDPVPEPEC